MVGELWMDNAGMFTAQASSAARDDLRREDLPAAARTHRLGTRLLPIRPMTDKALCQPHCLDPSREPDRLRRITHHRF